jgi:hypothetical protein
VHSANGKQTSFAHIYLPENSSCTAAGGGKRKLRRQYQLYHKTSQHCIDIVLILSSDKNGTQKCQEAGEASGAEEFENE